MNQALPQQLHKIRFGLTLAMISFVLGFALGISFGAAEAQIKTHLKSRAAVVLDSVYRGDEQRAERVWKKSWSYFKRAHLHAGAMGAAALAMMLLAVQLPGSQLLKTTSANMLGVGAVGYPLFWLLAGLRSPTLGDTHMAKESLAWLAIPSASLFTLGTLLVLGLLGAAAYRKN
jgi:hypothetical protein